MKIFSDKQLTVGEVWLASIKLFCKTFLRVWPIAAIFVVIQIILKMLFSNFYQPEVDNMTIQLRNLFWELISMPLAFYISGVLLHRIYIIGDAQSATFSDSLAFVWKKYFRIFGSSLLAMFVSTACFYALFLLVALVGVFFVDNLLLVEIVSGLGMCVLAGLFIVQFLMMQLLILIDDKKCLEAFKNSYSLVWGSWWRAAFPLQLLLALYVFMALHVFTMPLVKSFIDYYDYGLKIITIVIVVLLTTLLGAYALVQFGDLKLRQQKAQITK